MENTEKSSEKLLKLSGVTEEIIFSNPSNGYAVCDLSVGGEMVTVTGFLPDIAVGDRVSVFGEYVTHPEYGEQFKAEYYEKKLPEEEGEIEKYLASGMLPGIGRATARAIVEKFGKDSLGVIENDPSRLLEIKGLSQKKIDEIHKKFLEQLGVREAVMFFQSHGLPASLAARVFRVFGSESVNVAKNSPYKLIDTVDGFTFENADKIAHDLNFEQSDPMRVSAGVKYVLHREANAGGHTYLPKFTLMRRAQSMLGVEAVAVEDAVSALLLNDEIVCERNGDDDAVYLEEYYSAECGVAERLRELSAVYFEVNKSEVDALIAEVEENEAITLAESQRLAVEKAIENSALVITGGPGTGKTTIVNTIIRVMERLGKRVVLAAPTGRAAKRMSEVCGIEAKTIHRLLEFSVSDGDARVQRFSKNERSPLQADVVIIDEMSMVDTCLMNSLLKALPIGARLIMVGDSDQLPSVGVGSVLRDIIDSELLECIRLTEIFRQARESMIVVNSHKINNGEYPVLNERDNDFFFVHRNDARDLCETIVDLCANRLPRAYGIDSLSQIQVLTPARKTEVGATALNRMLQSKLNPPSADKPEKELRGRIFRLGDKVMQCRNNYQLEWRRGAEKGAGIFNGAAGFITDIDMRAQKLTVTFDDKEADYDFLQLDDLEHSYAITVL